MVLLFISGSPLAEGAVARVMVLDSITGQVKLTGSYGGSGGGGTAAAGVLGDVQINDGADNFTTPNNSLFNWSTANGLFRAEAAFQQGQSCLAIGANSHAEGYKAEAQGIFSHAEGDTTTAEADYSHAEGWYTITRGTPFTC